MKTEEIFLNINSNMIKGVMFHEQMANYFDFLNLHGYKTMHEYHALDELFKNHCILNYYIQNYNYLLPNSEIKNTEFISSNWFKFSREQIDYNIKKKAIKESFSNWKNWEETTKKLYEESYYELLKINEFSSAFKVKDIIVDVDLEFQDVKKRCLKLEDLEYNLTDIYCKQDEICKKYTKKIKNILEF